MGYSPFVGRQQELDDLKLLLKKKFASLVVVQGRRRIGKSRLIQEFSKGHRLIEISGIPPNKKTTAKSQRDEFARQMSAVTELPEVEAADWNKLFALLASVTKRGRVIILLDEISWMGTKDPDFLGKLKNAWDLHFKKNPSLILVLCGSASAWIEENIFNNTGYVGRTSWRIILRELPLRDCNRLFEKMGSHYSNYEKLKLLAVMGGVPRYMEEVQTSLTVEENIRRLCFQESGLLFNEFEQIFSSMFSKRSPIYKKIIRSLAGGSKDINQICEKTGMSKSGKMSEYLEELVVSVFISRDYTWDLKTVTESRLSLFRLSDNYLRFYLKYIEKHRNKIMQGHFLQASLGKLPGWEGIMSLQFENLVLNNREYIIRKLRIDPQDLVSDNPYFQRRTARAAGCQIDYLLQTRFNALFACEVRFSRRGIRSSVIEEMKRKVGALQLPRGYSCFPVLIHVNGVDPSVEESGYFAEVIDFGEIFN